MRVGRPMPIRQVTRIVRQIASALAAAHARGIVHRDLKPENVVLVPIEGQADFVKILDFGISKARWSNRLTGDATVMGTPEFMAPEQAQGHREQIDARTDQFALAAMTYALLTGREPFTGDCSVTVLYQVVHEDPPPLADFVTWPTQEIEAVLRKGMAKRRTDRYPTVLDFARAFEGAVASIVSGVVPDGAAAPLVRDSGDLPPGVCTLATVRSPQPPGWEAPPAPAAGEPTPELPIRRRRVSPVAMAVAASIVVLLAAALGVRWRWGGPANAAVEETTARGGVEPAAGHAGGLRAAMTWAESQLGAPPPIVEPAAAAQVPSPTARPLIPAAVPTSR
jgi:serine/threonine-protein kinase